ncbi:cytochrome O ubiquinol oxidase [Cloacibacterium normanense]|uniref:Cytochrome O ubiquinol oxidase n=1 Tax=Cloacibacterium normanense TaxID=237258 RepID=A0A2S7I7Q8_9FLAO|nr:VTT domain-containing protein [Cloacibacterium normanense]MBV2224150.1 VTT domain-containing protein [Cloacibacterium sp.]PPZ92611.1 cytochrome O ubiquinol oxidase [Cloacibacterium normanense]
MLESIWSFLLDFVSKPDQVLLAIIEKYHNWVYVFLFLIIFAETGLIIASFLMPFLPGDALIFTIGLLAQEGSLNIYLVIPLLIFAAILGDNLNYYVGKRFGDYIMNSEKDFFIKKKHLEKAKDFFDKNGKNSIIIARFVPVIRTIVPFLCGSTKVKYSTFLSFSMIGAFLWVGVIGLLGYNLGRIQWVKDNLDYMIWGIIILANIPLIKQLLFSKKKEV